MVSYLSRCVRNLGRFLSVVFGLIHAERANATNNNKVRAQLLGD